MVHNQMQTHIIERNKYNLPGRWGYKYKVIRNRVDSNVTYDCGGTNTKQTNIQKREKK